MTKNPLHRPRIGHAHLGVIRAREDAGIEVDFVADTGMGTRIGAIHTTASGCLSRLPVLRLTALSYFDVVMPKSGLIGGARAAELACLASLSMPSRRRGMSKHGARCFTTALRTGQRKETLHD